MVIVISDGQVVLAHSKCCSVLGLRSWLLLVLFLVKDVIGLWLLGIHVCHLLVHVRDCLIHINYLIVIFLLCRTACITVHIDHFVVHVHHCGSLTSIRRSRLKPAIFQGHLLDGTCCRLNIRDSFLAGHALSNQELLLLREVVIKLARVAASPPLRVKKEGQHDTR